MAKASLKQNRTRQAIVTQANKLHLKWGKAKGKVCVVCDIANLRCSASYCVRAKARLYGRQGHFVSDSILALVLIVNVEGGETKRLLQHYRATSRYCSVSSRAQTPETGPCKPDQFNNGRGRDNF
jgi:hypothetical protein